MAGVGAAGQEAADVGGGQVKQGLDLVLWDIR